MKKLLIALIIVIVIVLIYFVDRNTTIFRVIKTCTGLDLPIYKNFVIKRPNYPFVNETYLIELDSLQMKSIVLNTKLETVDSVSIIDYKKVFYKIYSKYYSKIDTNFTKISLVNFKELNRDIYYQVYIDYKNSVVWVDWFD